MQRRFPTGHGGTLLHLEQLSALEQLGARNEIDICLERLIGRHFPYNNNRVPNYSITVLRVIFAQAIGWSDARCCLSEFSWMS